MIYKKGKAGLSQVRLNNLQLLTDFITQKIYEAIVLTICFHNFVQRK